MSRVKGTIKAEDGRYYTPEEMVFRGLRPANPKNRVLFYDLPSSTQPSPRKPKPQPEPQVKTTNIQSASEPQTTVLDKRNIPKDRYPRVTITNFDEKGNQRYTTFLVHPDSFHMSKNEDISYTATGKPKINMSVTMDFNVVEVE